jgi:hypothetical protein
MTRIGWRTDGNCIKAEVAFGKQSGESCEEGNAKVDCVPWGNCGNKPKIRIGQDRRHMLRLCNFSKANDGNTALSHF